MKLLAFDIDDTLIGPDKVFRSSTISAIDDRLAQGDVIVIASGRPYVGINRFLGRLQAGKKYAIAANGAAVYGEKGNLLMANGLHYQDFLDFYAEHPEIIPSGGTLYCYSFDAVAYFERTVFIDYEVQWNGLAERNLREKPLNPADPILKIMVCYPAGSWGDFRPSAADEQKYHVIRSDPRFLEFTSPDADKASGVEFLRNHFHLTENDVYCFGDQGNDVQMIQKYQGVAMGNAIPECKKVAKFVTLPVAQDGVSYALKHFVR